MAAAPGRPPRPSPSRACSCASPAAPRPYPLQLVAYGAAVVAAAFLLAWACEAAQVDIAHGVVVAAVAFVAILPEYIVELHFAFIGQAEYVTANLTGASRLLLGVSVALPAVVALLPRRWRAREDRRPVALAPAQRVELAILAVGGAVGAARRRRAGSFTLLDSAVLIAPVRASTCAGSRRPAARRRRRSASPRRWPSCPAQQRRRWVGGLMALRRRR